MEGGGGEEGGEGEGNWLELKPIAQEAMLWFWIWASPYCLVLFLHQLCLH